MSRPPFPIECTDAKPVRSRTERRGLPRTERRGTVLLLAVLIMSSVVAASVGLSSLILSSLVQTRAIDGAIVAFYAAESGIEEGLYSARRLDVTPPSRTTPQPTGGAATWTRIVNDREDAIYLTLLRDTFVEVALYDPAVGMSSGNIGRIDVSWTDQCSGCTVLTASVVGWDLAASGAVVSNSYTGGTASISIPDPAALNRVRLRAQGGDVEQLVITAYDTASPANRVQLPGRIRIDARGNYAGVEQRLTATLPRQIPLSGVYDFIIFSECSLVKGGTVSC